MNEPPVSSDAAGLNGSKPDANSSRRRRPRRYRRLTFAERKDIKRLLMAGTPVDEIAKAFGCSRTPVSTMAAKLGIKLDQRLSGADRAKIIELLRDGKTVAETARLIPCDKGTVLRVAKGFRMPREERITSEKRADVEIRLKKGHGRDRIAREVGVRPLQVAAIARKQGIAKGKRMTNAKLNVEAKRAKVGLPTNPSRVKSAYFAERNGTALFVPIKRMWDFRDAPADKRSCIKSRMANVGPPVRGDGSKATFAFEWLQENEGLPWFRAWLCGDGNAPGAVTIATRAQVETCEFAWSYVDICDEANVSEATYRRWIWEVLPRERLFDFLFWLYGAGKYPRGWLILPTRVVDLRHRLTPFGICDAIGVSPSCAKNWRRKKEWRDAVEAVLEAAARASEPSNDAWIKLLNKSTDAKGVAMIERMRRFGRAATLKEAVESIGWNTRDWQGFLAEARKIGGTELEQRVRTFVGRGRLVDETPIADRRKLSANELGVVAPGLFAPNAEMVRFREFAKSRAVKAKLATVRRQIPWSLYQRWMLEWTVPRKTFDTEGARDKLIRAALDASEGPPVPVDQRPSLARPLQEPPETTAAPTAIPDHPREKAASGPATRDGIAKQRFDFETRYIQEHPGYSALRDASKMRASYAEEYPEDRLVTAKDFQNARIRCGNR
jgi:DNA invertase Pin-like site-specific DNA recombinase